MILEQLFEANWWDAIVSTLNIASDPSRRTFWLFLLSSIILLFLGLLFSNHNRKALNFQIAELDGDTIRRYFINRSHFVDLSLLISNNFLKVLFLIPLVGGHIGAAIVCVSLLQSIFGDAPDLNLHAGLVVLLYSLTFFIFEDLSRFILHRSMHMVPFLWKYHRVHHSASVLSPLTIYRVHPIEMLLYYARSLIVFGVVTGLFVYLFRNKVDAYDILGVDMLGFLFNFMGANLRHSHYWFSFGYFEKWFISPAQHQIHHSVAPEHKNKNFGTCFACWDKLAGSWVSIKQYRKLEFGLTS